MEGVLLKSCVEGQAYKVGTEFTFLCLAQLYPPLIKSIENKASPFPRNCEMSNHLDQEWIVQRRLLIREFCLHKNAPQER